MTRNHPFSILLILLLVAGVLGFGIHSANRAKPAAAVLVEADGAECRTLESGMGEVTEPGVLLAFHASRPARCDADTHCLRSSASAHPASLFRSVGWMLPLRI